MHTKILIKDCKHFFFIYILLFPTVAFKKSVNLRIVCPVSHLFVAHSFQTFIRATRSSSLRKDLFNHHLYTFSSNLLQK